MPQMMPLFWSLISLLTLCMLLMTMILTYFFFNLTASLFKMNHLKFKHHSWNWKW